MSNKIILCGLQITSFPESKNPEAESALLLMLYPLENVNAPKFKRKAVGQSTETPFGKQSLSINAKYAQVSIQILLKMKFRKFRLLTHKLKSILMNV